MTRRPALHWALALVVALGARVAIACPTQAIAQLSAVRCCAEHCHKTRPGPSATRCCRAPESGTEPAALSSPPHVDPPVLALVAAVAAAEPVGPAWVGVRRGGEPPGRAGPVFLLTRSLRL